MSLKSKESDKEYDVIGLGEVLLRLSPVSKERILTGEGFTKRAGGSELNVVSGISLLGLRSGIITKLPSNEIGKFIKSRIRFTGVSDDYIVYDKEKDSRLGIYYYEYGSNPRKPVVVYDRLNSSFTNLKHSEINTNVFSQTRLFHVSGITLGLNEALKKETIALIKEFKKNGAKISFDVNFRASIWSEEEARVTITEILSYIDYLFISEETFRKMFNRKGNLKDIMREFSKEYGNEIVATTQRKVISPTKHTWDSIIYSKKENLFYQEEEYKEIDVVDRIGSGDAYLAGTLFGILKYNNIQKALEYGNAMAAIKNTIPGDMPVSDFNEINRVIKEHKENDGSEMIR
jgi:2-dehydro-3-deoxygluconokinase